MTRKEVSWSKKLLGLPLIKSEALVSTASRLTKINIDAAIFEATKSISLSSIIIIEDGEFIRARAQKILLDPHIRVN